MPEPLFVFILTMHVLFLLFSVQEEMEMKNMTDSSFFCLNLNKGKHLAECTLLNVDCSVCYGFILVKVTLILNSKKYLLLF